MPRIVMTLCLLPALLLTQWLSVGQCSCVCAQCDDVGAAHVHVASPAAKAAEHGCQHQHCCQHRAGRSTAGSQHGAALDGRDAHTSADIVYLPHSLLSSWLKQATALSCVAESGNLACPLPPLSAAGLLAGPRCQANVEGQRRATFRPGADAPLYLRTLTLLI